MEDLKLKYACPHSQFKIQKQENNNKKAVNLFRLTAHYVINQ